MGLFSKKEKTIEQKLVDELVGSGFLLSDNVIHILDNSSSRNELQKIVKKTWKSGASVTEIQRVYDEKLVILKDSSDNKDKNELFVKGLTGTGIMSGGLTKEMFYGDKITNGESSTIEEAVKTAWEAGISRETLLNIFKEELTKVSNQESVEGYFKRADELFEDDGIYSNKEKNKLFVKKLTGTGFLGGGLTEEMYHSNKIGMQESGTIESAVKTAWKNGASRESIFNIFKEELSKVSNQESVAEYFKRAEELFENEK